MQSAAYKGEGKHGGGEGQDVCRKIVGPGEIKELLELGTCKRTVGKLVWCQKVGSSKLKLRR